MAFLTRKATRSTRDCPYTIFVKRGKECRCCFANSLQTFCSISTSCVTLTMWLQEQITAATFRKATEKTLKFESSTVLKRNCSCVFADVSGIVGRTQESRVNPHNIPSHSVPFPPSHYKKKQPFIQHDLTGTRRFEHAGPERARTFTELLSS